MPTNRLRILVLTPGANPKSVTGPLIGFSHSDALSRHHEVTIVAGTRHEEALRNAKNGFRSIEFIPPTWVDKLYAWIFRRFFNSSGNIIWSIIALPTGILFECRAWFRLRKRIFSNEFDIVLRLLPIDPKAPSAFAFFLRNGPVPFVIGPLNGGLPWPTGFSQLDKHLPKAGYWAAKLRSVHRLLPFARSTYTKASAIIVGSSNNFKEFSRFREKVFFVPGENGVNSSWFKELPASRPENRERLEVIMVNRLVPLKAVDLALRGAAPLLRKDQIRLNIVGDGPERQRIEKLVDELGVRTQTTFVGWVSHQETLSRISQSDILLFPSLREFGGGVVFEALALGAVPVVADFGGPGDIVTDEVGCRIPLINEEQMPSQITSVLERLTSDRDHLETLRQQGRKYVQENLTWEAKARMVTEVLLWAAGSGSKPTLPPPERAKSA